MPALVIYYGAGPLPVSVNFDCPTDGDATFVLSGTSRTATAAVLTGITLSLDGSQIGTAAVCWANQNNNHTAMMPVHIPVETTVGAHTIEINNMDGNTITDVNDYFQVVLLY